MKTFTSFLATVIAVVTLSMISTSASANSSMSSSSSSSEYATTNSYSSHIVDKYDKVLSHDTDVYRVTLERGERWFICLSGDGDTDLDLYVYDENGNLIDSDSDSSDDCVCTVTPKWTGRFTIKIVNRGSVFNRYHFWIY